MKNIALTMLLVSAMETSSQPAIDYRRSSWAVLSPTPWRKPPSHASETPSPVIANSPCIESTSQGQDSKHYSRIFLEMSRDFCILEVSDDSHGLVEGTSQFFECSQSLSSNHTMTIPIKNNSKAGAQDLISHSGKDIFKPQVKLQFDFRYEAKGGQNKVLSC